MARALARLFFLSLTGAASAQAQTISPPRQVDSPSLSSQVDVADPATLGDPPTALIDFLGRRFQCAHSGVPLVEQTRLNCSSLGNEEREWRTRFADAPYALRWLDQAPLKFRLQRRLIATFDGPIPTRARRIEQSGVDDEGRPYRIIVDTQADDGRVTRISGHYAGWPERSFTLDNRAFPLIDLHSLAVGVLPYPEFTRLSVRLYYGHSRDYCGEDGHDGRSQVAISFAPEGVGGTDMQRTNCQRLYVDMEQPPAR